MTPAELISSLQPASEAPAEGTPEVPAEVIEDIPVDKFFTALNTVSGGAVKDRETFNRLLGDAGRIPQLQQRLNELEAQSRISPFASPLTERINAMAREGRTPADLASFMQLSTLDVNNLPKLDAIQRHYQLSKPGWTPDDLLGLIENDLGFDPATPADELTNRQRAVLQTKHEEAVSGLKKQQVSAENPEAVAAAQAMRQRNDHTVNTWKEVVPSLAAEQQITLPVADGVQAPFTYKPSPEAIKAAQKMVMNEIADNPHLYPPTMETGQEIQRVYQQFIALADQQRRDETLARHAYAQGLEAGLQRTSGNQAAITRQVGQPQQMPKSADVPYGHLLR